MPPVARARPFAGRLAWLVLAAQLPLTQPVPLTAQLAVSASRAPWRLDGHLSAGYENTSSRRARRSSTDAEGFSWGGDLNLHGFLIDPRFVVFDLGGTFYGLQNDFASETGSSRSLGYRLTTMWFPERPWPLTIRATRNNLNSDRRGIDSRFEAESDVSNLGLDWQLRFPGKPVLNLRYDRTRGSAAFPVSGAASSHSRNRHLGMNLSHIWNAWSLSGGYLASRSDVDFGNEFRNRTDLDQLTLSAHRPLGRMGTLRWQALALDRSDSAGSLDLSSRDVFVSGSLDYRHRERLAGSYRYDYSETDFAIRGASATPDATSTLSFHDLGASLTYDVGEHLQVLGDAEIQLLGTEAVQGFETPDRLLQLGPGLRYRRLAGPIAFTGSYRPLWSRIETSVANTASTWSHQVQLTAETGDRSSVSARLDYRYSDLQQVTRRGAFDRQDEIRLTVISSKFEPFTLRASVALVELEFRNLAGEQVSDRDEWQLGVDHPVFSVSLGRGASMNDGLVFAEPLSPRHPITQPLPVENLVPAPFAGRSGDREFVNARFRYGPRLDIWASYRREENDFVVAPSLDGRFLEIAVEYRLGRVRLRSGYLSRELVVGDEPTRLERYYLRVSRSFSSLPVLALRRPSPPTTEPPMSSILRRSGPPPTRAPVPPPSRTEAPAAAVPAESALPIQVDIVVSYEPFAPPPSSGELEAVTRAWAAAWSERRTGGYLEHYSEGFRPPSGLTLPQWRALRRERLERPAWIEIEIGAIEVRFDGIERAVTIFEQGYRSNLYRDEVLKTLFWIREGGVWRIVEETEAEL